MPDNATGTDIATRSTNPLVHFREQLEQRAGELKMALPDHISPAKFQRTIITAVQQNSDLLGVSRTSLILACMKAAQDGLLPDGREAALVPFKRNFKDGGSWKSVEEAAYIPMVYGVRKKILQARDAEGKPVVSALEVGVVYRKEVEAGHFYYEVGKYPPLGHRPMLDLTGEDTTDEKIVGAYSIATMADGTKSYEFMRRFEIDKVQNASQTGAKVGRDGKVRIPKGPWADWYPEMCKKTVLRRHAKSLPQSGDLIIEADDDDGVASESAALMLGAVDESSRQLIADESGDTNKDRNLVVDGNGDSYDGDTGELIPDDQLTPQQRGISAEEAAQRDQQPAQEKKPARAAAKDKPEKADKPKPPTAAEAQEFARDEQTGVTRDEFEIAADAYLDRFSKAENVIDLDKAHKEFEDESEGWPYEIVQAIEAGYKRHLRRLAPAKAEAEPEPAK